MDKRIYTPVLITALVVFFDMHGLSKKRKPGKAGLGIQNGLAVSADRGRKIYRKL